MEPEAWPSPQPPARDPLPRVEDLPVADQGYDQESVKTAFDSFYRHAAQLDAALRTLEAVDSFHQSASSLRSDLRALRAAGWTQQSWSQSPSYSYGMRAPREGVPPALWRIGGEVAFLVAVAVALGVAQLSWWLILVAMAAAFAIVCLIEWLASREQLSFVRPTAPAPAVPHPVVEAQRAEDTDEHDSLGWTAFEEPQEPSDAMTIIGAPGREEEEPAEPVPLPATEPDSGSEEPELPPAAEADAESGPSAARSWWHRRRDGDEPTHDAPPPRHVRVLPAAEESPGLDPWEDGFDGTQPGDEEGQPELADDEQPRRFRRR